MRFETWEPIYESILTDFGYPRDGDERARDVLAAYATPFDFDRLDYDGEVVAVVGAAPSLPEAVDRVADADRVVAASTAADVVRDAGYDVDLFVTDLDKNPETARELTKAGTPVAAHAHGDNVPLVEEWAPQLAHEHVVATTQAAPTDAVYNFGGFTDGDRAAFIADEFGAAELRFVGWDFDDPSVSPSKAKKLRWAERLLHLLERRRDERFAVLDGRRDDIDPLALS
ncbi:6-hydroxymethylpterin diphosphokinase MptE-like protein [Halobellus inordinatus]|uniref:6-hydroxymethylpterin diphosphokinase MptE-like protein n=1 Tax=Halobellus inordinatus TaxID=1126236 RepID=UPI00210B13BA|nr:6-hydroxymethylpterin diphosphokinase MptE-like protein [Halobellus inordinatus]